MLQSIEETKSMETCHVLLDILLG